MPMNNDRDDVKRQIEINVREALLGAEHLGADMLTYLLEMALEELIQKKPPNLRSI